MKRQAQRILSADISKNMADFSQKIGKIVLYRLKTYGIIKVDRQGRTMPCHQNKSYHKKGGKNYAISYYN